MTDNCVIIWQKEVDSTNKEAERRLCEGSVCDNLSVIAALSQTEGQGQGDHKWHSQPGANLTFTITVRYENGFDASRQKQISDLVAHSVMDYLATKGITSRIKLPNDIYVDDKKICGLLIRHHVRSCSIHHSIIGVGLNVNQTSFPDWIPNPTSIKLLTGKSYDDLQGELKEFIKIFRNGLERLLAQ